MPVTRTTGLLPVAGLVFGVMNRNSLIYRILLYYTCTQK